MAETGYAQPVAGDLAEVVARFGGLLHAAGLPVGADRCERFARAVLLARPRSPAQLRWCARTTLAADPNQIEILDRVFDAIFGGYTDPADARGDPGSPEIPAVPAIPAEPGTVSSTVDRFGRPSVDGSTTGAAAREVESGALATAAEYLSTKDFADLSPDELAVLAELLRGVPLDTPPRRVRRSRRLSHGSRVDLRATLRQGRRTAGEPVRLVYQRRRVKMRRLVALCDISGSMQPYTRALLHLLYYAASGGTRAEVFSFATRLTRLTRILSGGAARDALDRVGNAVADWSGGTRIGMALKEFIDSYGRRGLARGAVVLIISDGWESGDPADLGRQMARLSRLAYRVVWVNPRTKSPRYRPLVGGMAAAWPYCDAVVSAHRLAALAELRAALADPVVRRRR